MTYVPRGESGQSCPKFLQDVVALAKILGFIVLPVDGPGHQHKPE